ncbi:MAG: MBL fold metallo-hydrolase [Sumerlaeia bacterium]
MNRGKGTPRGRAEALAPTEPPTTRIADFDSHRLFVIPLGIGNAFTKRFFNTSLLLIAEGRGVLVDCPSPLRRVLGDAEKKARVALDIPDFDHLVLTHLHGDHCNGVEEFGFFKRFVHGNRPHSPPDLYALPEVLESLWEHRLMASMGVLTTPGESAPAAQRMGDYFRTHAWMPGRELSLCHDDRDAPAMTFRIRRTQHFLPCFGLVAEFNGIKLGYSCDTAFDPEHIAFLEDADLILHECGPGAGHTPLKDLLALPPPIRRKMLLIHVPDNIEDLDSEIPVADEGAIYDVRIGRDPVTLREAFTTGL